MKDNQFYELAMGAIILFLAMNFMLPGSWFLGLLFIGFAITAVAFFIRGTIEFIFGKGTDHLLMGVSLIFIIILLFNGTALIQSIFRLTLSIFGL